MAGKDRYASLFIEDRLRLFRGAAASVPLLGLDLKTGYIVGTTAMAGDLVAIRHPTGFFVDVASDGRRF